MTCKECTNGYLLHMDFGNAPIPAGWTAVQRCDECATFEGDEDAARAAAKDKGVAWRWFEAEGELPADVAIEWVPNRADRLAEVIKEYPPNDPESTQLHEHDRYTLIEKSRHDGGFWVTCWELPDAAADYHDGQEYPEDFEVLKLIDLDTGKPVEPITITTFEEPTNVRKFLDLSNWHLPAKLRYDGLSEIERLTVYATEHGWFLWVPDDIDGAYSDEDEEDEDEEYAVPETVFTILRRARSVGCDYVLFDTDGPIDDELPTFYDED